MLVKSKYTPASDSQQLSGWKQLSSELDSLPVESIDDDEARRIRKILDAEKGQERFDLNNIDK